MEILSALRASAAGLIFRRVAHMRAVARLVAALAGLTAAGAALGGLPDAVFEHGDIRGGAPGEPIEVRTGLLQIELAPGVVASASGGTTLQVSRHSAQGVADVSVLQGSVRIVQTETGQLLVVGPGRYVLTVSERLLVRPLNALGAADDAWRHLYIDYRQGFNLADSILLRQNEALKVDTRSFVRSIFGVFRP